MDIQLKKGLLEMCVLTLLNDGESYGYKIASDLSDVVVMPESTLYPILKRLESGGYVETYPVEHNGRLRKYFSINKRGIVRLNEFKNEFAELDKLHKFIMGVRD